ncbi:MAG TPA: NADH-quinone oxidoreductase subunit L, partial [Hyphomicrobiales bacterium]|nr:NADH-quinone oxidoreductase subunit L [Hyphomicrobiales bacterium]
RASEIVTCTFLTISAVLSWVAFFSIGVDGGEEHVTVLRWLTSDTLQVNWAFRIDTLTAVMLVVVNTVSALVHWYSIGYMHHDPHRPRFFAYLSLFTFAMLMLVTADNFLQLFFGWEGVGLASYLLIGFWYLKPSANAAAIKAFVVNRVGDFGFALGILAIFLIFGTISFEEVFANAPALPEAARTMTFLSWEFDTLTVICLLLFMGAMGKSAQFLLHTWLPDAMEGPTPVSALIHAATMVTAGVFMVARLSPLFALSETAMMVVTIVGATTAFFAATVGLVQNDIKRVIAYSTCSQLGYMFVALGVGAFSAGIFHLFTHAFFKALLFLGSGAVIHAMSDEQDMRNMGGLRNMIPVTYWMMAIGTLALTGFPFTAGFFSKDAIIESAFVAHNGWGFYAFLATVIAAGLTSFYSWRLMFLTFHGRSRASADVLHHVHESPAVMLVPLGVLAIGALGAGYLFKDLFIGGNHEHFWREAMAAAGGTEILEAMHHAPGWVAWSPTVMMAAGFVLAWYMYIRRPEVPVALARRHVLLYKFLLNKWYFDEIYDFLLVRPAMRLGRFLWKQGDGRVIDGFGPDGVSARVLDVTRSAVRLQSGYVYHYAFAMLIGVAALITWYMFTGSVH